jgi:hypothetical protein
MARLVSGAALRIATRGRAALWTAGLSGVRTGRKSPIKQPEVT